jgi:hypothetical protein
LTIEHVIVLVLFVVIPVVQALRRKLEEAHDAGMSSARTERSERPGEPAPAWQPPPPAVSEPAAYTAPAPRAPPFASEPPPLAPRQPPSAPLERDDLLPTGRDGLQRVMALTAIFGPPRSLDPYQR